MSFVLFAIREGYILIFFEAAVDLVIFVAEKEG